MSLKSFSGRRQQKKNFTSPLKIKLIFDLSLQGFFKWVRARLSKIPWIEIIDCPLEYKKADLILARFAFINDAYIVTTDRKFPYEKRIILPMRVYTNGKFVSVKYEKLYVILMKEIAKIRKLHQH